MMKGLFLIAVFVLASIYLSQVVIILAIIWLFAISLFSALCGRRDSSGKFRRFDYFVWGPLVLGYVFPLLVWLAVGEDALIGLALWLSLLVMVTVDHANYLRTKVLGS